MGNGTLNCCTILELIIKCLIKCFIFETIKVSSEYVRVQFDVIQKSSLARLVQIELMFIIPFRRLALKTRMGRGPRAISQIWVEWNSLQRSVKMEFMPWLLLILARSNQLLLVLLRFSQILLFMSFNNYLSIVLRGCFLLLLNVSWLIDA